MSEARIVIATEPDVAGGGWEPGDAVVVSRPAFDPLIAVSLRPVACGAAALTIDVTAPAETLRSRVRDALGWAREMLGGQVIVQSVGRTRLAAHALLEVAGVPVVFGASVGAEDLLHLETLGPERVEVTVSGGSRPETRVATGDGVRIEPPVWETRERRALQRAATALSVGGDAGEGAAWRRDDAVCRALLGAAGDAVPA